MTILLNGESRELEGPTTVSALLQQLGIDSRVVAVEVDRIVVKRAQYADTVIKDGAEVEVVAFVGGGATALLGQGVHRPVAVKEETGTNERLRKPQPE